MPWEFINKLVSSPMRFFLLFPLGFIFILFFVLIFSIYIYLIRWRNKELSLWALSVWGAMT